MRFLRVESHLHDFIKRIFGKVSKNFNSLLISKKKKKDKMHSFHFDH
jgi:hypothetical protein